MASSSIGSPISNVPYEILREIFIHCLPRYRLRTRQPNVTIAPMLLCQICSSWRMVALTSPTLWSHIFFGLSVDFHSDDDLSALYSDWIVPKNEYSFLMWWKKNQGSMALFLRLDLNWTYKKGSKLPELELSPVEMTSFFEYISSAHHFETEAYYWYVLAERNRWGYSIVYPYPHTLVKSGRVVNDTGLYDIQFSSPPNPILAALQKLSIYNDDLPYESVIPNCWSTLTHISLTNVEISLQFWFPLIRAVPDLQWGNFEIWPQSSDYALPTEYTLFHLSTLFVVTRGTADESVMDCPLSILFAHLHLPALKNLSLSADDSDQVWHDQRAIPELYTVLHSTPAITTLTLGCTFLSLEYIAYSEVILPAIGDVEPVWTHAPCLVHLRLEVMENTNLRSQAQVEKAWDMLIRDMLYRDTPWLALENPACPIQEITMVNMGLSARRSSDFAISVMSTIQKHPENIPNTNIIFQVISEWENQSAAEVWNE